MSAIYQGEVIEITPQDLQTLEQELNPEDDYQTLKVVSNDEEWLDKLLENWESKDIPISPSLFFRQVNMIEKQRQGFTEEQIEELWEESYRLDSDIEEQEENEYL